MIRSSKLLAMISSQQRRFQAFMVEMSGSHDLEFMIFFLIYYALAVGAFNGNDSDQMHINKQVNTRKI
jgi:hypothetical protein